MFQISQVGGVLESSGPPLEDGHATEILNIGASWAEEFTKTKWANSNDAKCMSIRLEFYNVCFFTYPNLELNPSTYFCLSNSQSMLSDLKAIGAKMFVGFVQVSGDSWTFAATSTPCALALSSVVCKIAFTASCSWPFWKRWICVLEIMNK